MKFLATHPGVRFPTLHLKTGTMARLVKGSVFFTLALGSLAHTIDESKFKPEDIITRDVAVVGGGASGTYAAVRLKDQGKTVALIERDDHLVRISGICQLHERAVFANDVPRAAMSTHTQTLQPAHPLTMVCLHT